MQRQLLLWSREQGLHLMSDNGCQPTAVALMKTGATLGITQTFTVLSYNSPYENANTGRLMRSLKEELLWVHERTSPVD